MLFPAAPAFFACRLTVVPLTTLAVTYALAPPLLMALARLEAIPFCVLNWP
jgi:hypothetical protein